MARSQTLREAVERQAGACRSLALALETHASHRLLLESERSVLLAYSAQMLAIADGLTLALAQGDSAGLRRLWGWSRVAISGLVLAMATGAADGTASGLLENDVLQQCVGSVSQNSNDDEQLIETSSIEIQEVLIRNAEQARIDPTIQIAASRYKELLAVVEENDQLRDQLETRKSIDRAKGKLMDTEGIGESAAFRFLQQHAVSNRMSMKDVAESVLSGELVFPGPKEGLDSADIALNPTDHSE